MVKLLCFCFCGRRKRTTDWRVSNFSVLYQMCQADKEGRGWGWLSMGQVTSRCALLCVNCYCVVTRHCHCQHGDGHLHLRNFIGPLIFLISFMLNETFNEYFCKKHILSPPWRILWSLMTRYGKWHQVLMTQLWMILCTVYNSTILDNVGAGEFL